MDAKKQWVEDILPNWEKKKASKKVRELIGLGIPPSVRGTLWPFLIGNDLRITPELFEIFGARAARAKQQGKLNVSLCIQLFLLPLYLTSLFSPAERR